MELAPKPANFAYVRLSGGQKILIHGAAGGVGSFAYFIVKPNRGQWSEIARLIEAEKEQPIIGSDLSAH